MQYIDSRNGILVVGPDWQGEIERGYRKLEEAQRQTEAEYAAATKAWQEFCEAGCLSPSNDRN